jgi:glycerophosphoryl diester phosphodiesterase
MRSHVNKFKRDGKPLILAHRGLVTRFQENTLASVKAALEDPQCDGTEFDVFLTRDKKVVLCHDENLLRLTGRDLSIYDLDWSELKEITVLPALEVDGGLRQYDGPERFPLLSEVLEEIRGKDFFVDVEIKAYKPSWKRRKTGAEVARVIRDMKMESQLVCTSFDFFMLGSLENEHRGIMSGYAYDDDMPLGMKFLKWATEANLVGRFIHSNAACIEHSLIDEDTITKYHKRDMPVGTFTLFPLTPPEKQQERYAFFASEVRRLAALGVDWIETDNPALVHEILYGKAESQRPE